MCGGGYNAYTAKQEPEEQPEPVIEYDVVIPNIGSKAEADKVVHALTDLTDLYVVVREIEVAPF